MLGKTILLSASYKLVTGGLVDFFLFIYLWLCWVFLAEHCGDQWLLCIVVHRLPIAVTSLVAENRLQVHGLQ